MFFIARIAPVLAQEDGTGSSGLSFLLLLAVMGAIFYLVLYLPQRRRMRKQEAFLDSLDVGDRVRTVGGIVGRITALDEQEARVEVAPGIELTFVRRAVGSRIDTGEPS